MSTTASTRGTNAFLDTLFILDSIAASKTGLTVGEVGKLYPSLTRRQVQKIVDNLEAGGMVFCTVLPHGRTGKKVFGVTEYAAIVCASVSGHYAQNN